MHKVSRYLLVKQCHVRGRETREREREREMKTIRVHTYAQNVLLLESLLSSPALSRCYASARTSGYQMKKTCAIPCLSDIPVWTIAGYSCIVPTCIGIVAACNSNMECMQIFFFQNKTHWLLELKLSPRVKFNAIPESFPLPAGWLTDFLYFSLSYQSLTVAIPLSIINIWYISIGDSEKFYRISSLHISEIHLGLHKNNATSIG